MTVAELLSLDTFFRRREVEFARVLDLRYRRIVLAHQEAARRSQPPHRMYLQVTGVGPAGDGSSRCAAFEEDPGSLARSNFK